MTKQEVREETKETEGDPQLKARIRQIQREMSNARMMQEVPKADALVVNPTHFSVALLYDRDVMEAPQVIAKGTDFLALRMRTIANENAVPIVEKPALARELYASVDRGDDQSGNGVSAHKLGGPVQCPEIIRLTLDFAAALLGCLIIDQAGVEVSVDGHLLAGHRIQGEAGGDFSDPPGSLCDHDKVDDHQNQEDDDPYNDVASHNELAERFDDRSSSV